MAMTDLIQPDSETHTLNRSIVDEKEPISESCALRSKSSSPSLLEASRSEIKASTRHHLNGVFSSSSTGLNIYLGSYGKYSKEPTGASRMPLSYRAPRSPVTSSLRKSAEYVQLGHLLETVDVNLETYGFEEVRDGFFDASFYRPSQQTHSEMMDQAPESLSNAFHGNFTLSARKHLLQRWHELSQSLEPIFTSRSGVKLSKSVLGVFAAYVICLIPSSNSWLGKYNYVIVVSSIINHPGRSLGSQIDGALMTISGTVMGLGWGSLALYVSTSSTISRSGYGGVLAAFLILFSAAIAWLRCLFIRFYQAVLSAGIAICYICLADTSQVVGWRKVFDYGVPWIMGQALCLVIAVVVFPATGSRAVSLAFHQCIKVIQDSLILPHPEGSSTRRALAWNSVGLSQSTRDFTIELTISRFRPDDIRILRNLFQSVLRGIMAANLDAPLFSALDSLTECIAVGPQINQSAKQEPAAIEISKTLEVVTQILREPTRNLINAMVSGITSVDKVITAMGRFIDLSTDELSLVLDRLRMMMNAFDSADTSLINHPDLPQLYSGQPIVVEIFLFVHPIRQISDQIEAIIMKVMDMQGKNKKWNLNFPSYPWSKSLLRTNAQVRHDRGGLTAGFYFRHKMQLERTMEDLCSKAYVPRLQPQKADSSFATSDGLAYAIGKYEEEKKISLGTNKGSKKTRFRHKLWELIHRLQGFESRFALKVTLVTTLVSVPAWLSQSNSWWNKNEIWWAVVIVWIMMHPRVGGTFQDLAVRSFCAALGSTWAALGYAADNGNPYVMAVFAALFMIPMIYRFTQSSHPRSGIVGCISFTVVSLSAYTNDGQQSIVKIAWTKGLAFVVGVVAAIVVNWVLWPFVARHELRKSLSAMLLHSCLLYRGVVAKYIYYTEGDEPGPQDIERSEMLEGRLREGFVRIRQLLDLTQHEIRLRAPFNAAPYSALIDIIERFFEHLVSVRQSSLYFRPNTQARSAADPLSLLTVRRDAVAVILMNLYVLACALRADQPVPLYLPSAAAARQRLLDRMGNLEAQEKGAPTQEAGERRWKDVYRYAFSSSLTEIVGEVQDMQKCVKEICGEFGLKGVD